MPQRDSSAVTTRGIPGLLTRLTLEGPELSNSTSVVPPLLRLPKHIRRRIYGYLGLVSWDGIPHRCDLSRWDFSYPWFDSYNRPWIPMESGANVHALLLSCRLIYAEAAALIYSLNPFVIYFSQPSGYPLPPDLEEAGLRALHALTAVPLHFLSSLKIILNQASCHQSAGLGSTTTCCFAGNLADSESGRARCVQEHAGAHQPPLLGQYQETTSADSVEASDYSEMIVQKWHSAAEHIFSQTVAGRLALYLVCDIEPSHPHGLDLARAIVAPILTLPPSYLRECHIRLAQAPDSRFQQLAQNAACHASGIPMPSSYDPLGNNPAATTLATLPCELRIRILEYTDLVTPRRQVFWSRQDRAFGTISVTRNNAFYARVENQDQYTYTEDFSYCRYKDHDPPHGCFCGRRHSAYTPRCNCWAPPGPDLFLINRALCEDARFVFFSKNRFVIHDHHPFLNRFPLPQEEEHPAYPYPRLAISEFLRDVVPPSALRYLRLLHVVYPAYHPRAWPGGKDHPAIQDWQSTINWLVEYDLLTLPALTLRLVTTAPVSQWATYRAISPQERETILEAYLDLIRPLKQLAQGGLAGFYAELSDELRWDESRGLFVLLEDAEEAGIPGTAVHEGEAALKERAEKWVMGDRYENLYAVGKKEPRVSDWELYCYYYRLSFGLWWGAVTG
ncbi:uncharacterized protein C8A04DRAFT_14397 [Dichotomopilus funicola]|uniref:Uncharacterized protein n=1 Tax=Dichotomopilus funicola TaxID=1934379 RepID=A0AAN6ZKD1_9PEZI|nr:hypothetical protein C8A04DRAFT_14397 [Dichotomopilus funicola]